MVSLVGSLGGRPQTARPSGRSSCKSAQSTSNTHTHSSTNRLRALQTHRPTDRLNRFGLLGLSGFSLSGTLAIMEQYAPERYLHSTDGSPFYPASAVQTDGDLNVVCPTKCEFADHPDTFRIPSAVICDLTGVADCRDAPAIRQAWRQRSHVL